MMDGFLLDDHYLEIVSADSSAMVVIEYFQQSIRHIIRKVIEME